MQTYRAGRYDTSIIREIDDYMNRIKMRGRITMVYDKSANPNFLDQLKETGKSEAYRHYAKQRLIDQVPIANAFYLVEKRQIPQNLQKYLMPDDTFPNLIGKLTFGIAPREASKKDFTCELLLKTMETFPYGSKLLAYEIPVDFQNLTFARGLYYSVAKLGFHRTILKLDLHHVLDPDYLDRLETDGEAQEAEMAEYKDELETLTTLHNRTLSPRCLSLVPVVKTKKGK